MNILHAIIFGIVQGLTEFLPISSSAHLRLTPLFLKIDDPGAGFSAVIQLGTVLAVVIYFWSDLLAALKGWVAGLTDATKRDTNDYKMGWAVFIGTIPVIVAGLLLKHKIEHEFRSLYIMAGGMIVMGFLMWAADQYSSKKRTLEDLQPKDGLLPGLLQCMALAPGMSRSGSSITGALFAGFDRRAATRFSFLMSVPSVAGAGFYELFKARHELQAAGVVPTVVATVVSFVVGYASIKWLIEWISKHGVGAFTLYRLALGGILLGLLMTHMIDPMAGADKDEESPAAPDYASQVKPTAPVTP